MNIIQVLKLSLKKIKFSKGKSLFVIIPIALMFGIIVFIASEASNLITVAHNGIFSPIQSQNEVIELNKTTNPRDIINGTSTTGYTATDLNLVKSVANIEKASQVSVLPISNISSSDLFTGKTFNISSLAGLDSSYAALYTSQPFTYTEGQPIPIILNANDFSEAFVDWGGKTTINVDFSSSADPSTLTNLSPIKTKAITYDRNSLIGQTFTINFGGLDNISNVKQVSTATGYQFVQKTQADIDSETAARKTAIEKYWDYTKISTPISVKFVVAGISEGTDKTKAYIPADYAQSLISKYLTNETSARNTVAMASTDENATFTGLVYDGVTLGTDTTSTIFANLRNQVNNQVSGQIANVNQQINAQNQAVSSANAANSAAQSQIIAQFEKERAAARAAREAAGQGGQRGGGTITGGAEPFGAGSASLPGFRSVTSTISQLNASAIKVSYDGQTVSYNVPGLIYSKDRTTGTVSGEKKDLTTNIPLVSNTILIKLSSIDARDQAVKDLNTKGYRYTDYSQYKQYNQLETYIHLILNIATVVFMAVTALFILINMAKFVSEGKKEIGIYRAIGATKGDIRLLFILQTLAYIILSLLFGALVGTAVIFGLSNLMVTSANYLINTLVGSTVAISGTITTANFIRFDLQTLGLYTGAMLLVTLIVSLIPSGQAAKVSPIEAIRNA
ncbi:MAG: FtsX-like permease family protein [bacterium]